MFITKWEVFKELLIKYKGLKAILIYHELSEEKNTA